MADVRQHHDLAEGKDVNTGAPKHSNTGDLNPTSDDTKAEQAGGGGHVHKTDPASDAGHHHGGHEHHHMHHHMDWGDRGGHKHMHEHHPSEHDGGHGDHPHFGRKRNY